MSVYIALLPLVLFANRARVRMLKGLQYSVKLHGQYMCGVHVKKEKKEIIGQFIGIF